MSVTLYLSKISINSHIYQVYEKEVALKEVLKKLYLNTKEGTEYIRKDVRVVEDGESYLYDAIYSFNFIDKPLDELTDTIVGSVLKTAKIFINDLDEKTGKVKKRAVENKEIIDFYFDVYNEIVVFHTTNRFGYKEFNLAFKELINKCMSSNEEPFNFEVGLLKQGLNVPELKEQLHSIGRLQSLRIDIIPPNPDDELLNNIQENGEVYLGNMKAGNITEKSILFTSSAPEGLNIDSKIINKEIESINDIHSKLTSEEALNKGYVNIEAENKNGRLYSTRESKSVKYKIDDKPDNLIDFAKLCKKRVASLLNSYL